MLLSKDKKRGKKEGERKRKKTKPLTELLTFFITQDQVPDDPHTQDHQCTPCDFVENPRHCSQVLVRLLTKYTKHDIPDLLLQLVSQDSVQELIYHIETLPNPEVSRSEFHVRCLRIRFVSQGVVRVCSVGLGSSWTFSVIFFNDSRGSTYLSLCICHLTKRQNDECQCLSYVPSVFALF